MRADEGGDGRHRRHTYPDPAFWGAQESSRCIFRSTEVNINLEPHVMRNPAGVESALPVTILYDFGRRNQPAFAGGAISAAMTGWSCAEGALPEPAPISPGVRGAKDWGARGAQKKKCSSCRVDERIRSPVKPEARAQHRFKAALMMTWMASPSAPYLTRGVGTTEHCALRLLLAPGIC